MLSTVRRYFDATAAVAIMAILGIFSGFIAVGLTGDPTLTVAAAGSVFILTGERQTMRTVASNAKVPIAA